MNHAASRGLTTWLWPYGPQYSVYMWPIYTLPFSSKSAHDLTRLAAAASHDGHGLATSLQIHSLLCHCLAP